MKNNITSNQIKADMDHGRKKTKRNYLTLSLIDLIFIIIHLASVLYLAENADSAGLGGVLVVVYIMAFDLVFMIINGVVAYLLCRNVFYPNIIIAVFSLVSLLITCLVTLGGPPLSFVAVQLSTLCCCYVTASLVSSIITMLISKLCKASKKPAKKQPVQEE